MRTIFYTIIMILFVSCSSQKQESAESANILFGKDDNSELTGEIKTGFIQFEETDSSLLGSIRIIFPYNDRLIVANYFTMWVFDKEGKYITQIGSQGQGVGEYTMILSAFIDESANAIGVYDGNTRNIIYYDLDSYNYVSSHSYPEINSTCCIAYGENLIWYNAGYDTGITDKYFLLTDKEGNIKNSFVDKEFKSGYITGASYPLYTMNGNVYGFTPYDMVIYEIGDSTARSVSTIQFDGLTTPSVSFLKEISDDGSSPFFNKIQESGYISYYDVRETNSIFVVTVMAEKKKLYGIMDKSTGRSNVYTEDELADSLHVGKIPYFIPTTINDKVLAVLDTPSLREMAENGYKFDERLSRLLESDNENPIILTVGF